MCLIMILMIMIIILRRQHKARDSFTGIFDYRMQKKASRLFDSVTNDFGSLLFII